MEQQIKMVRVGEIDPSPYQPRKEFREEALAELADSMRQHGLFQPLVLRRFGNRYQVIAGERRLRAARKLAWGHVPAIIRDLDDEGALEAALIENLQREDLSPLEAARAYERLQQEFGYNQGEIALRTGKSRVSIVNSLRLLTLSEPVLALLEKGAIAEGHARAIAGLKSVALQEEVAQWAVANAITVRELESKVKSLLAEPAVPPRCSSARKQDPARQAATEQPGDANLQALQERLRSHFGTKVILKCQKGRGTLTIEFYSDDDLDRIIELTGA
jgi:ParB family chromosome partitioning protein